MKHLLKLGLFVLCFGLLTNACDKANQTTEEAEMKKIEYPRTPDWAKNANIYEVNTRQYTKEGTFKAFEAELPRLKEMGVDILWFMPIHEISKEKRKGELGSPYAIHDYYDVNPDMGTLDDFKALLKAIHDADMKCIIDWVPNHSGWGNAWITEHPEWYTKDKDGNITDPLNDQGESWGWTDVAEFNYDVPEMRRGMIDAMKFWVAEIGIDGFRVDVAHGVPADFWAECTKELFDIRPLFMLAESEIAEFLNMGAYAMDYAWSMHHTLNDIAKSQGANRGSTIKLVNGNPVDDKGKEVEKKTALDIDSVLARYAKDYKKGYKMQFTSNHDENSWAGTEMARMGDGHLAFAVLTATFDGMPLIYSGQESAFDRRLEFFKKDDIDWGTYEYADFYKTLLTLKHNNKALWNGEAGGPLVKLTTGNDEHIYAFGREKDGDKVVVIINLSSSKQSGILATGTFDGEYNDIFKNEKKMITNEMALDLEPWAYCVLSNK